ncbi:hypothetical protein L7F22_043169 [Adiantum nelumboides]|nr:hypothetical protein [Adiantum nelumboides]
MVSSEDGRANEGAPFSFACRLGLLAATAPVISPFRQPQEPPPLDAEAAAATSPDSSAAARIVILGRDCLLRAAQFRAAYSYARAVGMLIGSGGYPYCISYGGKWLTMVRAGQGWAAGCTGRQPDDDSGLDWCAQTSNLQWILTSVPLLKALVLGLSFVFWYFCLNLSSCSFWVAFGVFVTRIFFETACFIGFLLISHGYCIMYEQLSISERRSIAGLSSLLYLTLTGYKAAVPQFAVLVVAIYLILLYAIFLHVSKNLNVLREQLQHIQAEGVQIMQTAVHTKYSMFKKFQGAMAAIVVAELVMHTRGEGVANEYWIWLLVREWVEIAIFFYIGWTFRSREVTPFFTVIPTLHSHDQRMLPPIYSIEMNQTEFNNLDFKEWHIGVSTPLKGDDQKPMLVIVRNPGLSSHEDNTRATSRSMPRKGYSLTKPASVNSPHSEVRVNNAVPSSRCFFSGLLKQGAYKTVEEGDTPHSKCQPYDIIEEKELLLARSETSSLDNKHLKSASPHGMLLRMPLQLEPFLSQFV